MTETETDTNGEEEPPLKWLGVSLERHWFEWGVLLLVVIGMAFVGQSARALAQAPQFRHDPHRIVIVLLFLLVLLRSAEFYLTTIHGGDER